MPSMPRMMIATWTTQKTPNAIALCPVTSAQPEVSAVISVSSATAPIQVWMPNQPHATRARAIAATLAPRMPKLDREQPLPPLHAGDDQAGGERVGGDHDRQPDPQRGEMVRPPRALLGPG